MQGSTDRPVLSFDVTTPRLVVSIALFLMLLAAGCAATNRPSIAASPPDTPPPDTALPVPTTATARVLGANEVSTTASTSIPTTVPTALPTSIPPALCASPAPNAIGRIESDRLLEISGLVAATTHDGFWAHNDGGDATLYAVGPAGEDLGEVTIEGVEAFDLEDIAVRQAKAGPQIVLADIGDNTFSRGLDHQLLFVDEPTVAMDAIAARVAVISYPDGPHNAEVLLIDSEWNQIMVVTKEDGLPDTDQSVLREANLYVGDLPVRVDGTPSNPTPIEMWHAGTIDLPALRERSTETKAHPFDLLELSGLATGGDVSPDGRTIALRTYGSVWLWPRPANTGVADVILEEPCEAQAAFELQGEALAFIDNNRWATVAEGQNMPLHIVAPSR